MTDFRDHDEGAWFLFGAENLDGNFGGGSELLLELGFDFGEESGAVLSVVGSFGIGVRTVFGFRFGGVDTHEESTGL